MAQSNVRCSAASSALPRHIAVRACVFMRLCVARMCQASNTHVVLEETVVVVVVVIVVVLQIHIMVCRSCTFTHSLAAVMCVNVRRRARTRVRAKDEE